MEPPPTKPSSHNLFEVYLRLRPPPPGAAQTDRILNVEQQPDDDESSHPSHITLNPPTDRRRAIEKFAFTKVFGDEATQLDVFHCTQIASLAEGVLAPQGGQGTDAVIATLGVTGSGKVRPPGYPQQNSSLTGGLPSPVDAHDTGVQVPARPHSASTRRGLQVHLPQHAGCIVAADRHRLASGVRSLRVHPARCAELPGLDVRRRSWPFQGAVARCYTHGCTTIHPAILPRCLQSLPDTTIHALHIPKLSDGKPEKCQACQRDGAEPLVERAVGQAQPTERRVTVRG